MYDILPFPNITATDAKEQVAQINNYLIQFKETLEFILTNISVDNLSQDLINKLNSLGAEVEKTQVVREEELQQVSNRMITVSDVLNSSAYKKDLEELEEKLPSATITAMNLRVNYETGELEYDKEVTE
jgi:hypothetical protein